MPVGAVAQATCCGEDADCGLPSFALPPPFAQTEIEDGSGEALAPFYADLARTAAGQGKTRIAFFGDSHTATDRLPGRVRHNLQALFGWAGPGLVMPGKPLPWYKHRLVVPSETSGWRTVSACCRTRTNDPHVGLGGFALRTRWRKPLRVRFGRFGVGAEAGFASRFEVHYLKVPGGGRLHVSLDGEDRGVIPTASTRVAFGRHRFEAADGRHRMTLRGAADGEVTVLGVSGERAGPGVVVDTLGIIGARAREQLGWDEAIFAAQLAARRPNLLVLAYGTNEAMDEKQSITTYEAELHDVVMRARRASPAAACLLVGPSDHPVRRGTRYRDRKRTGQIVAAQRRVAAQHGCASFDLVAATGGPLSMRNLVRRRPFYGAPDHIHFTRAGYRVLGDALTGALLRGYRRWLEDACGSAGMQLSQELPARGDRTVLR